MASLSDEKGEKGNPRSGPGLSRNLKIALCLLFIILEVLKQIVTYAAKELHDHRYPISSSTIVFLTELCKLLVSFVLYTRNKSIKSFTPSLIFAIPSLIYTANNNLFLYALQFMPPPTWNILVQSRVIMTALTYYFVFKRPIGGTRWGALGLLLVAIALAELSGAASTSSADMEFQGLHLSTKVITISLTGAALSTTASIITEYLYKNDIRTFLEQQVQLYFFSAVLALLWSFYKTSGHPFTVYGLFTQQEAALLFFTVFFGSVGGLTVALIVKKIDNIAKIYSASLAVIATAALCAVAFPHEFKLNVMFFIAVVVMCISLVLYEIGKPASSTKDELPSIRRTTRTLSGVLYNKRLRQALSVALLLVIPVSLVMAGSSHSDVIPIAGRAGGSSHGSPFNHTSIFNTLGSVNGNESHAINPLHRGLGSRLSIGLLERIDESVNGTKETDVKSKHRNSTSKTADLEPLDRFHEPFQRISSHKSLPTRSERKLPTDSPKGPAESGVEHADNSKGMSVVPVHPDVQNKVTPTLKETASLEKSSQDEAPVVAHPDIHSKVKLTPSETLIVPNIVHYLWLDREEPLEFHHYISIKSAKMFAKPEQIFVHITDERRPGGTYWDKLERIPGLSFIQLKADTESFVNVTFNDHNDADLSVKLQILNTYGGCFLDNDVVILKPLEDFRKYDMVVTKEFYDIQTSILFATKPSDSIARFLRESQQSKLDQPLHLATLFQTFVEANSATILIEEERFKRHDLLTFQRNIFFDKIDYSKNHGFKLFYEMYGKNVYPHEIGPMDTTFGDIARTVYYGSPSLRFPPAKYNPSSYIVPNVVRYVWFEKRQFNFINYLSVLSALKFQNPESVVFHVNTPPRGELWEQTANILGDKLRIVHRAPANDTFGRTIGSLSDAAQLASLEILKEEGGIFLENDVLILRNLNFLRNFDFTITMEVDDQCRNGLHTGVMLARKSAEMTHELCGNFRDYHRDDPGHIGRVMLQKSEAHADWLNIELASLTRPNWSDWWSRDSLWRPRYAGEMRDKAYAIHLLCEENCDKYTLENSKDHNSKFGDIVRHILEGEDLFVELPDETRYR